MVITLGTVGCRSKDDKKVWLRRLGKREHHEKNKTFIDSCYVCDGMKFTPMAQERPMSLKMKN